MAVSKKVTPRSGAKRATLAELTAQVEREDVGNDVLEILDLIEERTKDVRSFLEDQVDEYNTLAKAANVLTPGSVQELTLVVPAKAGK